MHIVPLRRTPVERYPSAEIVRLSFNETGFARLVRYLGASFDRNKENTALPGLYQDSRILSGNRPVPSRKYLQFVDGPWAGPCGRQARCIVIGERGGTDGPIAQRGLKLPS